MKIFISWSGETSKKIAVYLKAWLGQTIQALDPWISTDIEKGARWSPEIRDALEKCKFGIVCIDPSNMNSPWLLFEAGALSKATTNVFTLLKDISPTNVEQPLGQFQHTIFTKEEFGKLLMAINRAINAAGERALSDSDLQQVFDRMWPELERFIRDLPIEKTESKKSRTESDLLQEAVEILRRQERRIENESRRQMLATALVNANLASSASNVGILSGPHSAQALSDLYRASTTHESGLDSLAIGRETLR